MKRKNSPKINPRRRPASQADVIKAKEEAVAKAIVLTKALTFTALLGEGIIKPEDVRRGWEKQNTSQIAQNADTSRCRTCMTRWLPIMASTSARYE